MSHPEVALERIVADIVVAFLQSQSIDSEGLPDLVKNVRTALVEPAYSATPPAEARQQDRRPDDAASFDHPRQPDESHGFTVAKSELLTPKVPIAESIGDDCMICLEDGKRLKSLRRHLKAKYDLTPEQYRERWGLPADYPMVAPSYSRRRAELARSYDFGRSHRKPAEPLAKGDAPRARRKKT
jgi:predicted transcriptional regulator